MAMRFLGMRRLIFCIAGLILAEVSQAGVVYSALPNESGGSDANGFLEADDITLASRTRLGIITFWTFQTSPTDYTGSIAWSIRSNAGGSPGASIASGIATPGGGLTGKSAFGLNEFVYAFGIDFTVDPGTYWIVLHNGPNTTIPPTDFFWGWSNGNAGNSMSQDLSLSNQPWISNFAEFALQVQDIPEPGSLLLTGVGILAIWVARRRP